MVQIENSNLSNNVIDNISQFADFLYQKEEACLFIKEDGILWQQDELENTRKIINDDIEKLKNLNLSTFEQFLYIYNLVGNRIYEMEEKTENSKISRSVIGVLNSNKIVCTGYANLLKAYITALGNSDINCDTCIVDLYKKAQKEVLGSHCVNVVYIKDDKYKINGAYVADCCWDSIKTKEDVVGLAYCLIPAKDVVFYDNCVMVPSFQKDCKYYYFLSDIKPQILLKQVNQSALTGLELVSSFNLIEERNKFRSKMLEQYESALVEENEEKLEKVRNALSGTDRFDSPAYEYAFLRHMYNKIQKESLPISYEAYSKALVSVVPKLYPNVDYKGHIEHILKKSKDLAFTNYAGGAENCFSKLAKSEFDLFEARRKEERERRQKAKQKMLDRTRQNNI